MAATTVPLARRFPGARVLRRAGRRGPRTFVVVVAVAVAGAGVAGLVTRSGGDDAIGAPAPTFSLSDVRSPEATVVLPTGRPTVVNFFAAWCTPCRAELPVLQEAARRTEGSVAFVGVDVNDSRSAAADLLAGTGVSYPAGYDPDRSIAARYRLQGMPTTVFIGADGRIDAVARGRLTAADLDRRLDRLEAASRVGTP
ncbi:MAG TPA: TlpA disulfide reductase family protein [Acidimicrobiales bacterium]|nr:TlpA disulfide reductase family protein [Acidimicrobiales bacterium]